MSGRKGGGDDVVLLLRRERERREREGGRERDKAGEEKTLPLCGERRAFMGV